MSDVEFEELVLRNRSRYGATDDDTQPSARMRAPKPTGFNLGDQEML